MMLKRSAAVVGILLATFATSAFAKENCEEGYKTFMKKSSVYFDSATPTDLADAVKRSFDAYSSCKAGDDFSPHGVWDGILADMAMKSKR